LLEYYAPGVDFQLGKILVTPLLLQVGFNRQAQGREGHVLQAVFGGVFNAFERMGVGVKKTSTVYKAMAEAISKRLLRSKGALPEEESCREEK
jgi:hypothetical protein